MGSGGTRRHSGGDADRRPTFFVAVDALSSHVKGEAFALIDQAAAVKQAISIGTTSIKGGVAPTPHC